MSLNSFDDDWSYSPKSLLCSFGITEGIGLGIAGALTATGVGAETAGVIASIAAPALLGAATGAAGAELTGGDPGKGALFGGLSGGVLGGVGDVVSGIPGGGAASTGATSAASVTPAGGLPAGTLSTDLTTGGALSTGGGLTGAGGGVGTGIGSSAGDLSAAGSTLGTSAGSTAGASTGASTGASGGIGGVFDKVGTGISDAYHSLGFGSAAPTSGFLGNPGAIPGSVGGVSSSLSATPISVTTGAGAGADGGGFLGGLVTPKTVIPALGLGYQVLQGQGQSPLEKQLQGQADTLAQQGGLMTQYLNTGKLPPGVQSVVDQQTNAAEAGIRSNFASLGLSGSTMEAQALADAKQTAAVNTFNIADKLLSQGVQESALSGPLYQYLINNQITQDKDLTESIAGFAAAANGYKPS